MSEGDAADAGGEATPDESATGEARPDDRRATERARYLTATTDLRRVEAEAVAWSELGYSESGIAKRIESSESTVHDYLERAIAAYGPEAAHAKRTSAWAIDADLTPLTPDDVADWPAHYREWWHDAAERHPDRVPDAVRSEVSP